VSANGLFAITAAGTALAVEFLRAEMKRVMQADNAKALLLGSTVTCNRRAVASSPPAT
jgi:hypothetical protein